VFNTHREPWRRVELTIWCVASADEESVEPTQQRQGRDGLLLIARQTFA